MNVARPSSAVRGEVCGTLRGRGEGESSDFGVSFWMVKGRKKDTSRNWSPILRTQISLFFTRILLLFAVEETQSGKTTTLANLQRQDWARNSGNWKLRTIGADGEFRKAALSEIRLELFGFGPFD